MIVLGVLVAGMTVTSGLLRVLEPGPVAPLSGITLQSVQRDQPPEAQLFNTAQGEPRDWQAIVIHDSGRATGSADRLHRRHERQGRGGLGYHFVVNNGTGKPDGVIEAGYRWQHQLTGDYLADGQHTGWFHKHGIGVCLVGNADQKPMSRQQLQKLVWLVQKLQRRYDIPADAVYLQVGSEGRDALFPRMWFREQLLTRQMP